MGTQSTSEVTQIMYGIVYELTCRTTGKKYVGQTTRDVSWRWKEHVNYAMKGALWRLSVAIRCHGADDFNHRVICECESSEELDNLERHWISELNTMWPNGYNMRNGGQYTDQQTRRKMSFAKKGIPLSDDHKERISLALMSHPNWSVEHHSSETRAKISRTMKGKRPYVMTDQIRITMSNARQGKAPWNKGLSGTKRRKAMSEEQKFKISMARKRFESKKLFDVDQIDDDVQ